MTVEDYQNKRERERKKALMLMEQGVEFQDIDSVYIEDEVSVGEGTFVGACVTLQGNTKIGSNCKILQNTRISDSEIGDGTVIESSVILESQLGSNVKVGPFAYIRPNSKIGDDTKVGDFVEVKNSTIGRGTKASHLTYIGDSDLGEDINLGCGVVFVNYDGTNKYRSTVGDRAFIGCNTNLISPVVVEEDSYIAAGSTINKDVPKEALAVARSKQVNLEGWAAKSGLYRKKER